MRTKEEKMVQELLNDWQKGAHGYIAEVKEDNVIQLGCENVNSLSIFHPTKSKMHKLTHLYQRHQMDGAFVVEHGINFKMAATGTHPDTYFQECAAAGSLPVKAYMSRTFAINKVGQ